MRLHISNLDVDQLSVQDVRVLLEIGKLLEDLPGSLVKTVINEIDNTGRSLIPIDTLPLALIKMASLTTTCKVAVMIQTFIEDVFTGEVLIDDLIFNVPDDFLVYVNIQKMEF